MKTTNKSQLMGLLVLLLSLFAFPKISNAQACPYTIDNKTNCDAIVDITLYDNNCVVCSSLTGVVIPFSSSYSVPCTGCNPMCQIDVQLNVLGVTITPVLVTYPGLPNSGSVTGSPCTGVNITAGNNSTVIQ